MSETDFSPLVTAVLGPMLWLAALAVVLGLLQGSLPHLRGLLGERAVARVLKRYALRVANDLILPNGQGGLTQIDHLALTPKGILVIETKSYRGLVFGQTHEKHWTQVIGRRRQPFHNPLRQNYGHIKAVEALVADVPIEGRVVFVGRARFPKGKPSGVIDLAGLEHALASLPKREIPLALLMAWEDLIAHGRRDRRTRRAHRRGVRAGRVARDPGAWMNADTGAGLWRVRRGMLSIALALALPALLFGFLNRDRVNASREPPPLKNLAQPTEARPSKPPVLIKPATVRATPHPVPKPRPSYEPEANSNAPAPPIQWSDHSPESTATRLCREAQVAVLIENSATNRRQRERACAGLAAVASPAVVVDEPGERLHSAGQLTPN